MSDLKLRGIQIRNWMSIREADLEFPEKGLVLMLGLNSASGGKLESVGSGKTALGEAISRALVGVKGRYAELGHYSTDSRGNMYVKLSTTLKDRPFIIEMGHKCKELSATGEGLKFSIGDEPPIERGHSRDTRKEILSALNITSELADWTVYIDGDRLRFNKMSERQSVGLLMTALQQPSWEEISKRSLTALGDAKSNVVKSEGQLGFCKSRLTAGEQAVASAEASRIFEQERLAKEQASIDEKINTVKQNTTFYTTKIKNLNERQKVIKREMQALEKKHAESFAGLDVKRREIQTKLSKEQIKRQSCAESRASAKAQLALDQKHLRDMQAEPDKCPTCGGAVSKTHGEADIAEMQKQVNELQATWDTENRKVTVVGEKISALEEEIQAIDDEIAKLRGPAKNNNLSTEYENNEKSIKSAEQSIQAAQLQLQQLQQGPSQAGLERSTAILHERQAQIKKLQTDVEDAAEKLAQTQEIVKIFGYWNEAFGPTGIPNMILREALKPLNDISKRISSFMTGGTLEVSYDTTRRLSSGESSAELVINVNNKLGSKRVEGSSKGESGLTNLIIAETLSEVGSISKRVGYRWYDEILNSQDSAVRQSILTYLRDLANRLGILIFVVDHHAETANYADYVLVAEKSAGGTQLYWSQ